jgi:tRNA-specific 2-thiouridylase
MSRNGKVIVAMSGGVDSSVTACLLKEQGYECIGVFMRVGAAGNDPQPTDAERIGDATPCAAGQGAAADAHAGIRNAVSKVSLPQRRLKHGCCSASDALDARLIAGKLGIPFYALNFESDFERIIDYFVEEYAQARTPNPCVMCNIHLKFGKLLRYADAMDAEFVATGHYARILRTSELGALNADGTGSVRPAATSDSSALNVQDPAFGAGPFLARAANRAKDQSYVLFGIRRDDLPRCVFPLGGFPDKAHVRQIAAGLGLRVHDKPDSQEICFVPGDDYTRLLDLRRPEARRPGEIRDAAGRVLGVHAGYQSYTIGQRRGLGLALGEPVYVTRLDAATNTVVVGSRDELLSRGLRVNAMNWLVQPPTPREWQPCAIKIRHMHSAAAGGFRVHPDGGVEARFEERQPAVTPGQAAVLYAGDIVLGGGWIRTALD